MASAEDTDFTSGQNIHDLVLALVNDRDRLRIELAAANQVIEELSCQNSTYESLVRDAHSALQFWDTYYAVSIGKQTCRPASWSWGDFLLWKNKEGPSQRRILIEGTWLPDPAFKVHLEEAEQLFKNSKFQRALNSLSTLLAKTDINDKVRVNAMLLTSDILRTCDRFPRALSFAEDALRLANANLDVVLVGKAQFYRGLCLYAMEHFAEASWCFSFAAGTVHHVEDIKCWKARAEDRRVALAEDDSRRHITASFEHIPSGE